MLLLDRSRASFLQVVVVCRDTSLAGCVVSTSTHHLSDLVLAPRLLTSPRCGSARVATVWSSDFFAIIFPQNPRSEEGQSCNTMPQFYLHLGDAALPLVGSQGEWLSLNSRISSVWF